VPGHLLLCAKMSRRAAALVVALQMDIWGTGKSPQDHDLMIQACDALCGYLEALR
jgi:hypothetical protein